VRKQFTRPELAFFVSFLLLTLDAEHLLYDWVMCHLMREESIR
jgi:hypothetical protein